jgi:hypothetical protein
MVSSSSISLTMAPYKVTLHTILPASVLEFINQNQLQLQRLHCAGKKNMMIDCHHFAMFDSCC